MSRYLPAQGSLLKLNLLTILEKKPLYGLEIARQLKKQYAPFQFAFKHEHVYKALHELVNEGILYQKKEMKTEMQEIVVYHYAPGGKEKAKAYRIEMKIKLDRSIGLLQEAVRANY